MNVVELRLEDIDVFAQDMIKLLKQSFAKSFPDVFLKDAEYYRRIARLKAYIKTNQAVVYGVRSNGHLLAFVWFFRRRDGMGDIVHINHLVVHEKCRGLGLGTKLIDAVLKYAIEAGLDEIELFVTKDNDSAVDFYRNRGFDIERFVMKKRLTKRHEE